MSATMHYAPTASPEDQARAQLYGLIASLFQSAPDAQLLSALVHAEGFRGDDEERTEQGRMLAEAWERMAEACRSAFPVLLAHEHTELFAAPGRAEVTPYLLHYVMRYESETPLVDLRAQPRSGVSHGAKGCSSPRITSPRCAKPCDSPLRCSRGRWRTRRRSSTASFTAVELRFAMR
jgi:hypothetical protein